VFTYEANPQLEEHIRTTFALNKVAPHLTMALLGREAADSTFYVDDADFWASSTFRRTPDSRLVRVPTLGLNDEMRRVRPTFLIVDIEGGEADLFETIDLEGVKKISMEVHRRILGEKAVARLKSVVEGAGFRLHPQLSTGGVWFLRR
jgi:FkbM family methyltransferase